MSVYPVSCPYGIKALSCHCIGLVDNCFAIVDITSLVHCDWRRLPHIFDNTKTKKMKEAFTDDLHMGKKNIAHLAKVNAIIDDYKAQGYILSLRQLYYQLVSKDVIPNNAKEYAKLSTLLTKGRMAGIVDWSAIADRGRKAHLLWHTSGVNGAIETIADQYRLDRQTGQKIHVEVWVEKDALSDIFKRVTEPYQIPLMVNKGYSSTSAMYVAAKRFIHSRKPCVLAYFGDHDASGKDMVRDIEERLREMGVRNLQVINPALTMEQVNQYNPPPNFQKQTDPRAAWYIEEYGEDSWELDALEPQVLTKIINDSIVPFIDMKQYMKVRDIEARQKAILTKMFEEYDPETEDDFDGEYEIDKDDLNFNNDENFEDAEE